jgi:hypothetical protein
MFVGYPQYRGIFSIFSDYEGSTLSSSATITVTHLPPTNAAAAQNAMMPQMGMNPAAGPQVNPLAATEPDKLFQAEAENLELVQHEWILEGIEERLVNTAF